MARYGTLGDYRFADTEEAANDIRGAKLYGFEDKKLGEIDDVIFDEATGAVVYVVIDTGGWLSTKRFIVPPSEIRPSLEHRDDFLVDLTQAQIESFPAYDGTSLTSEEKWADYEKRYRSKWVERPVMHRAETDRNITPTTKQQVDAGSGRIPTGGSGEIDAGKTEVAPPRTQAAMDVQPGGPTLKWTTFEDTLRRRRQEVLDSSIENAKKASGEQPLERRKAS